MKSSVRQGATPGPLDGGRMRGHTRGSVMSAMRRLLVTGVGGLALIAGLAVPAAGITYGVPDAGEHPNVGAMLLVRQSTDENGETVTTVRRDCSGSLIGDKVFLTAGHCVAWMEGLANPPKVYVTFAEQPPLSDPAAMESLMIEVVNMTHAGFTGFETEDGDTRDLGLLTLAEAPPGLVPARLVDPGALDRMSRQEQDALVFTSVGYGVQREDDGAPTYERRAERMKAYGTLLSLTRNSLTISQNPARDHGGTCFGDSGGPIFATIAGEYVVTGVTSTGDAVCQATNKAYRVDSPVGQEYLAEYFSE